VSFACFVSYLKGGSEITVAKICIPTVTERILIRNGAPETDPLILSSANTVELLTRKGAFARNVYADIVDGAGKNGDRFGSCFRVGGGCEIELSRQRVVADSCSASMPNVKGRCRAGVPNIEVNFQNCGRDEGVATLKFLGNDADIRSDLPFFRIVSSDPLIPRVASREAGSYERQNEKSEDGIFERVLTFALGTTMIAVGVWIAMFRASDHGLLVLLFGVSILVSGWLMIAYSDIVAYALSSTLASPMLPQGFGIST
jgi:hypothetical protein